MTGRDTEFKGVEFTVIIIIMKNSKDPPTLF